MRKQNRTIEEKINDCLDNFIKNLHPVFREELYKLLMTNHDVAKSVIKSKHFITNLYRFPESGKQTTQYWIARGWNSIDASFKSKINNTRKSVPSPFSSEFWTKRINPSTNENYTEEEANYKRNSIRPIKKEFWLERGYSEEESIILSTQQKDINNKSGAFAAGNRDTNAIRSSSHRCKEYYILRGFDEAESINKVSNLQSVFSLDICIDKHGIEKGTEIWKDRQDRWQTTINSKSEEEKLEMNQKKGVTLRNMVRKYGDVEGEQRYKEWLNKVYNNNRHRFFSLESIKFFESFIQPHILEDSLHSENELFLMDIDNIYFYDLTYKNVIVEYHGHHVHPNTKILTEQELINWKHAYNGSGYEQCVEKDRTKRELAISNGFLFFEVFSNDTKEVIEETKNLILQALSSAE